MHYTHRSCATGLRSRQVQMAKVMRRPVTELFSLWARWHRAEGCECPTQQGVAARLISRPPWELFEQQSKACRDCVLTPM